MSKILLNTDKITVEYIGEGEYQRPESPPIIKEWIEDLRANPDKQARGRLHNIGNDTYCCLGRLCKLQDRLEGGKDGGIQDTVLSSDNPLYPLFGGTGYFEQDIIVKVNGNSYFALTPLNDVAALNFIEIASIIEAVWG